MGDEQKVSEAGEEYEERAKELLGRFETKRIYKGFLGKLVLVIGFSASSYHLFYAYFHPFFALEHRAIHWMFMASLIFLLYPAFRKWSPRKRPSVIDMCFLFVSAGICLWLFFYSEEIMNRAGSFLPTDFVLGSILMLLVLEAARRSTGLPVPVVAIIFLFYSLAGPYLPDILAHRGYSLKRISTYLALSTDGIFGVPLGVSANFILLFILYGAILRKSGAGKFFTDLAFSLTGGARGGPAKAAVVSSCFFGMISGSSVANTVTTGSFTIPLMKRTGYSPHFAGGVEASASTMGQIMPPIMGAAAFLMAEFLGIPYIKVCVAAAIPAVLSFFSTFMQVHFRAVLQGIKGMPRTDLPSLAGTIRMGWHHLISLSILVIFLVLNYSPERAVFWAIITTIYVSSVRNPAHSSFREMIDVFIGCAVLGVIMAALYFTGHAGWVFWAIVACTVVNAARRGSGFRLRDIVESFAEGAVGSLEVAAACAAAGIIIGSITMTGLGLKFSSLIVDISGGHLWLALPLTMLACLALGMGVPTTAQYIIISALVAPALVKLGVVAIAAHLFIFYFGTRADITPPVALAAYAGAGIAGASPFRTGITAFELGLAGYIVPFMFIYGPELLIIGKWYDILLATATAILGIYSLAAGVQNCMLVKAKLFERILFFVIAFLLIKPGLATDAPALVLFGIVFAIQKFRQKKESGPAGILAPA